MNKKYSKKYREITYSIGIPKDDPIDPISFTDDVKQMLRPVAETLAMLDGNAFFGNDLGDGREWYEQYLTEAWYVWSGNGGLDGWPSLTGWGREIKLREGNPMLQGLWEQYQTALKLTTENERDS